MMYRPTSTTHKVTAHSCEVPAALARTLEYRLDRYLPVDDAGFIGDVNNPAGHLVSRQAAVLNEAPQRHDQISFGCTEMVVMAAFWVEAVDAVVGLDVKVEAGHERLVPADIPLRLSSISIS